MPKGGKSEEERIVGRTMAIAEEFFGTAQDPRQIPINLESYKKLVALWRGAFSYELDEAGEPVSWIVVVPTQRKLAGEFMAGMITEKQLFERTETAEKYDALYLCSAFTVPDQRGKRLAHNLMCKAIEQAPLLPNPLLFAWPTTMQGEKMVKSMEGTIGRPIARR